MVVNTQDSKGRFVKGHPPLNILPGKNVGGAKKTIAGKVKDALSIAEDSMPRIFHDMIRDALDEKLAARDRQACREYLADRIYGKPNQPLSGVPGKALEIIVRYEDADKPDEAQEGA